MKIFIVHNRYLCQGGEDEVVLSEKKMLEHFGNEVFLYERTNKELNEYNFFQKTRFFFKDIYTPKSVLEDIKAALRKFQPDIVHVHNTFSVIGVSIYQACQEMGIPIVQTLHNYRFLCPIGVFYRRGIICEECTTKGKRTAIFHKCWKNSYLLSSLLVSTINNAYEKVRFSDIVCQFIVPTEFSRKKHIKNGWEPAKLSIKNNFLSTDLAPLAQRGDYALFVGALQPYKGVDVLTSAFESLGKGYQLKIIGDGPLRGSVEGGADKFNLEYLGQQDWQQTIKHIQNAKFLILPSTCYEVSPRVIIEAFACGVPVVVSNIGGMAELVNDKKTGLHFQAGDAQDLAQKAKQMFAENKENKEMAQNARKEFEEKYTPEVNYPVLMSIYKKAIESSQSHMKV